MLSCIVGKKSINSVDYPEIELRKWSERNLLKCPICGESLIYRHGKIKIPHFAHKKGSEDCIYTFYENETKEHALGKVLLYKWFKQQPNVENIQLESYIPETKQRPDLYFESEGVRYILEYQCSPILKSEYDERHELYRLNEIVDIWVFGIEKYEYQKFEGTKPEEYYCFNHRIKESERFIENNGFRYYLNPFTEQLFICDIKDFSFISKILVKFYAYVSKINDCWFDIGNLFNNSYATKYFNTFKLDLLKNMEENNANSTTTKDQENIFNGFIDEIIKNNKKEIKYLFGNYKIIKIQMDNYIDFIIYKEGVLTNTRYIKFFDLMIGKYDLNNQNIYLNYSQNEIINIECLKEAFVYIVNIIRR